MADPSFRPPIDKPAYPAGKGPLVLIDEAHENFHTADGRYSPFADLLRRDGYVVEASTRRFDAEALRRATVLVIANARQGFAADEIAAVRSWIANGGALLLIADHPPFQQPAAELGKALGVRFNPGVAREKGAESGRLVFRRADRTIAEHPVTAGVDEVATFTGSAFQLDGAGDPLLVFGRDAYLETEQGEANRPSLAGQLQGALLRVSKGRVAVFGEAAMFSAQLSGEDKRPMGMNAPIAKHNVRLLLNVMHWLTPPTAAPARPEIISAARDIVQKARYCTFITIGEDGHPQARVVDPLPPDDRFVMWIATNPLTRKVRQVRRDARVTLSCFDTATSSYVTVLGRGAVVTDAAEKQKHWKPEWAAVYPNGAAGSDFTLIKFSPARLEIVSESRGLVGDSKTWLPLAIQFADK